MRCLAADFRLTTVFVLLILILGAQSAVAQTASGVTASPVALSYGVPTGSTYAIPPSTAPASAPETVTVNITCSSAPCSSVTFTGATIGASNPALGTDNPGDFVVEGVPSCSGTLTSPNTCQVSLYYNASLAPATTLETALLTISSSAGNLTVPLSGAYGSIKLFDETNITPTSATFSSLYTIASKQLNLSCPAGIVPTATISGTPDGKGYVLVDNYITLQTGSPLAPVNDVPFSSEYPKGNICGGPGSSTDYDTVNDSDDNNCVSNYYVDQIYTNGFVPSNSDPDSFANPGNSVLPEPAHGSNAGGVQAINVQSFLGGPYPEPALFTLSTSGAELVYDNSTLFLQTNCTAPGIIPGASVTLNPINTSNSASLTQTADLDDSPGQNISFTTSSAVASQQVPGLVNNGVVPVVTDYPVPQQLFDQLVANTSSAPAICMRLAGEQDSGGNPMCKGFLLQCYTPGGSGAAGIPSGDNCYNAGALTEEAQRYLLFTTQYTSPDGPSGYNYLTNQPWVPNQTTGYALGQTVVDIAGYVQQATTAGLSGSGYPFTSQSETVGATTNDGTVIWTNEGVNACLNVPSVTGAPSVCGQGTGPALLMGSDSWLCDSNSSLDGPPGSGSSLSCTPPTTDVSTSTPLLPATYTSASCVFDEAGGLSGALCPLDVLTSFQGAADAAPKGTSKISNSLFIPVVNQPLPSATASFGSGFMNGWTNTPSTATIQFAANPAVYPGSGTVPVPNGFTSAAIYSVTAGFTAWQNGTPPALPDTTYPVPGDYSLFNSGTSATAPFCSSTPGGTYSPSATLSTLDNGGTLSNGFYSLHYFATDCALTEGLLFNPNPSQVTNPTANWASFSSVSFGVDVETPTYTCNTSTPYIAGSSPLQAATPSGGSYTTNLTIQCTVTDPDWVQGSAGSGFAPASPNSIQGSQSETVYISTTVIPGTSNGAAIAGPQSFCDLANNCVSVQAGPFSIADQVQVTVTASNGSMVYGGTVPTITPIYSYPVGANVHTPAIAPTCSTTATSTSPVGNNYISSCSGASDPDYTFVYVNGSVSVTAEPLTITATNTSSTYGSTPPTPTAQYTYGSVSLSSVPPAGLTPPACTTTVTSSTAVGTYSTANTCSGAVGANYSISYAAGSASVSAEPLTITASNTSFTFGSTPPKPTPLYTYGVISLSSVPPAGLTPPSCTTTVTSSTSPGSYPGANTCSGAVGSNYTIGYVSGIATVNAPLVWTITPSSYYFGELSVGQTATSSPLAIYNPGTTPVAITVSIPESGYGEPGSGPVGDPDDFHIVSNNCPKTLGGGATCYVTVSYGADSDDLGKTGVYAYVTVTSGKTVLVKAEVSGRAVDPTIKMSTTSFNFGSQTTGSPVTEQVLTLTNSGPTTWLIHNLTLSGSATFAIASGSNECMRNGSLAAGASCQVYVTFKPARKGSTYTASICINGNEANGPLNLALKGSGD